MKPGISFVRTVLGDIPATELGVCYAHEHVIIDSDHIRECFPDFRLDSVEKAVAELSQFRRDGGGAMVDSMPCGCGRNVLKMAEVARRSGVHLLVPTGVHLGIYYEVGHWTETASTEHLTDLFLSEIERGIDAGESGSLTGDRTPHRAGLIKIATAGDEAVRIRGLSARERRIFDAAAAAHRASGVPLLTHTEQGCGGMEQLEYLLERGVDLAKVVLSHTDRIPDLCYHRDLLSSGVNLEYDSAFRWTGGENGTLNLLEELFGDFPGQLLLGMDAARTSYWRAYGGHPGLSFLLVDFREKLRQRGLGDTAWQQLMVSNPAAAFALGPPGFGMSSIVDG